jgi:hypothetical protein
MTPNRFFPKHTAGALVFAQAVATLKTGMDLFCALPFHPQSAVLLEGEGWLGGRATGRVFMLHST